jgi:hypothetical protein
VNTNDESRALSDFKKQFVRGEANKGSGREKAVKEIK